VIATKTQEHSRWAHEAIEAGKHVIVEKPFATEFSDALSVVQHAEASNRLVTAYHSRRWDPDYMLVKQLLRKESLGSVYRIESRRTSYSTGWAGWGAEGMRNPWRLKAEHGGGMLNDWGTHLIDQILSISGGELPESVYARSGGYVWTHEVDDHFWAELDFPNGLSTRVEASNNHRAPLPRWMILGTDATLIVAGNEIDSWSRVVVRSESEGASTETTYSLEGGELANGFYVAFSDAVANHGHPPVPISDILNVTRIMEAIKEASKTEQSVRVQPYTKSEQ
jgi:predicted dehydrogenase